MDTKQAFNIGKDWVDITTLSGIPAGTEILLQNNGLPQDRINIATMNRQPDSDFLGVILTQWPMLKIDAGKPTVWAKLVRFDRDPSQVRTAPLQVQLLGDAIEENNGSFGPMQAELLASTMLSTFNDLIQSNKNIENQMKLLNLRVEEAFETGMKERDIDG